MRNRGLAVCELLTKVCAALLVISLAACAARTATPTMMSQPGDQDLTCQELTEEVTSNSESAADFLREHKRVEQENVGKVVVGSVLVPIGLLIAASADLSNAEQIRARSIIDRNERLQFLARSKGCDKP